MYRSLRRVAAAIGALAAVLMIVLAALVAAGQVSFVVTHGTSMQPVYYAGDLVVVARAPTYHVGQIVAYHQPGREGVVLHRIIGGDTDGFVIKGDSNQSIDPEALPVQDLVGRALFHIPQGGLWLDRLTSPPALGVIAFFLLGAGIGTTQSRRRRRRPAMSRHSTTHSSSMALRALTPPLRVAAALTAVVAFLAIALGTLSWLSPTTQPAAEQQDAAEQQMVFSYSAEVGQSAAYDSTTAHSPGPVFRALTDTVDLHLAYEGEPGSITITAELSTDGGWRSTIPLAAKTSFTGHEYQDTVQLDLAAIDAKAQAASAVTGLSSSPVAITIRAHIDTGEDPVFTPTLQLDLAPLTLGLAQDEAALTVTDTDTDTSSLRTENVLNILGVQLMVTTARIVAAAALLAALLAAGALAVLAARKPPGDENADIHRRYSQLLVPVQPIPAPAAGHLTDVANFSALVKLAERYGLLIMHWSDHTGHTYLVQDQDNTYRYRISTSPPPTHGPPTHTAGADTD